MNSTPLTIEFNDSEIVVLNFILYLLAISCDSQM